MFKKLRIASLVLLAVAITGGLYLNLISIKESSFDSPPQITFTQIEKTHNDPARIRKDFTFFFDFSMEAIDDNQIAKSYVIITEPNTNQTKIELVKVNGRYSDSYQVWNSGTYFFKFVVVDDLLQETIVEKKRTIVYDSYAKFMQKYIAEGWNSEFLMKIYRLDKEKVNSLYANPEFEKYLEDMYEQING